MSAWLVSELQRNIARILALYNSLPVWDYWRVVDDFAQLQAGHFAPLWKQHNEHRILFPELIFQADMFLWHGRQYLPIIAGFVAYIATWLLFWWSVAKDESLSRWQVFVAGAMAGVPLLWEGSALVLAVPFLSVWPWTLLGAAAAFAFLTLARQRRHLFLAISILSATASTYSEGSGLITWPLLLLLAFYLRLTKKQVVVVLGSGVLNIAAYFTGYHAMASLNLQQLIAHPVYALGFVASYLSMPFGGMPGAESGLIAGSLLLVLSGLCFGIGVAKRWTHEHTWVVLTVYLVFTFCSALLTAAGRMNPADPDFGAAKALRYLAIPELTWCAFLLLFFWTVARISRPAVFCGVAIFAALLFAYYLPKLTPWVEVNSEPFAEAQLATLSVEDGVLDPELSFSYLYPDLNVLKSLIAVLEQSNKSIYYHARTRWLNQPASRFAPSRPAINGAITAVYPVRSALQVVGWADDAQFRKRYQWLVLTYDDGRIAGFGRRFDAGFPHTAAPPRTPLSLAWAAYVPALAAGRRIQAYVIDARKFGLMPMAFTTRVPAIASVEPPAPADYLRGVDWARQGQGNGDPFPNRMDFGTAPPGPVGTFGGADSFTGSLRSSAFPRPGNGCLIFPVLTGPSVDGLSLKVVDAGTDTLLEQLPLRDGHGKWQFWKTQIALNTKHLRIVAEDEGRQWGQWLATAAPALCSP